VKVLKLPRPLAIERLQALRDLAARWNSQFVLVIPPSDGGRGDPAAAELQAAGDAAGVPVLLPVAAGSLPADLYADGFHLNQRGAEAFTARLIDSLENETPICLARKSPRMAAIK
jgi:lysophospholipase L1-like esterase